MIVLDWIGSILEDTILPWLMSVLMFLASPVGMASAVLAAVVVALWLVWSHRLADLPADPVTVEDVLTEVLRLAALAGLHEDDEDPVASLTFSMLAEQLAETASACSIHVWDDEQIAAAAERVDVEVGAA